MIMHSDFAGIVEVASGVRIPPIYQRHFEVGVEGGQLEGNGKVQVMEGGDFAYIREKIRKRYLEAGFSEENIVFRPIGPETRQWDLFEQMERKEQDGAVKHKSIELEIFTQLRDGAVVVLEGMESQCCHPHQS